MGGLRTDVPGILLDTASSASMSNFIPLDGYLAPRSRSSSIGTNIFSFQGVTAITEYTTVAGVPILWASNGTYHQFWNGFGFSVASFVSSNGIGSLATLFPTGSANQEFWDSVPAYTSTNNDISLVMAGQSFDTLLAGAVPVGTNAASFSYLTGAPRTKAVGSFNDYTLAWNTWEGHYSQYTMHFPQRVRWSDRGDPSNWTTGLSGFEDLLSMPGSGTKITTQDERMILFTDRAMWYGVLASYPAQFQFGSLDPEVGCPYPRTIVHTPEGLVFMDQATNIRRLPKIYGLPEIISAPVREILQANIWAQDSDALTPNFGATWATYDPTTRLYWLFLKCSDLQIRAFTLNLRTGVWAAQDLRPGNFDMAAGTYAYRTGQSSTVLSPGMVMGDTGGAIYSLTSTARSDNTQLGPPTATWKSRPLGGDYPGQEKTMMEVRFDYKSTSPSSATVTISYDNGNTFPGIGTGLSLGTSSFVSQAIFHVYGSGRYPMIRWQSEATGYQLHRCHAVYRVGGR